MTATSAGAPRRRRLAIDAGGRARPARWIPSPNHDARPAGTALSLIVVHGISLPPGAFGGDGIVELFTNRLDAAAHPYYATIAALRVSAHFFIRRDGELIQFVRCADRAWHAGRLDLARRGPAATISRSASSSRAPTTSPYTAAQYRRLASLARALARRYPGLAELAGHADVAPGRKTDPGPAFDWARLAALLGPAGPAVRGAVRRQGIMGGYAVARRLPAAHHLLRRLQVAGIYVATAVAIAASVAQIAWFRWRRRRIAPVHWISLAIIVVFGGATLLLQDETFIKWKPTVLYALFASILAVGRAGLRPQPDRPPDAGDRPAGRRLEPPDLVLGRLPGRDGRRQLVRRVPLHDSTPGSISRSGAASACSCCSRSPRASGSPATCRRTPDDRRSRPAARAPGRARPDGARDRRRQRRARRATPAPPAGGGHFSLLVVSHSFSGLPRLARHQRVLREVADLVPHPIHALSIKALTPEEFPS